MFGIRFLIKSTFLLGILGAILIVFVNIFDESLSPETKAFSEYIDRSVPDIENGYYYLMGMPSRETSDPHQTGRKLVTDSHHASDRAKSGGTAEFSALKAAALGVNRYEVSRGVESLCNPRKDECLSDYWKKRSSITDLLDDNQILFQRAERLRKYPHFAQNQTVDNEFPVASYSLALQKLYLANAGLDAMSGRLTKALHLLEKDASFWRIVLSDSNQLIGKMVSIAYLDMNFSLLSEILFRSKLSKEQYQIVDRILTPLASDEIDIGNSFKYELSWMTKNLRDEMTRGFEKESEDSKFISRWFLRLSKSMLYKENATTNDNYDRLSLVAKISGYPASDFLGHLVIDAPKLAQSETEFEYHFVYNPMGKVINMISANHYIVVRYIAKPHNLDAKLRLITIKNEIHKKAISHKEVPAFLNSLPHSLRNPYDGSIPSWEEKTGRIAFLIVSEKAGELKRNPLSGTVIVKL